MLRKKILNVITAFSLICSFSLNLYGANNEKIINANLTNKQVLNLDNYGGQAFADKHIKETSVEKQLALLQDKNEVRKRVDAVSDIIREAPQYNMSYKWGGNHPYELPPRVNSLGSIKNGMDCSGFITYTLGMCGLEYYGSGSAPYAPTARSWHDIFKGVAVAAQKKGYKVANDQNLHNENGWIYTIAYAKTPRDIKHISWSLENPKGANPQMAHARGGEKVEKTIEIANMKSGRIGISHSFNVVDIIHFLASNPNVAKQLGFKITPMMSPDVVREHWSQVRKGVPGGKIAFGSDSSQLLNDDGTPRLDENGNPITVEEEYGDAGVSWAYELYHLEFNFDEWFSYAVFSNIAGLVDVILPISLAIAVVLSTLRLLFEIFVLFVNGRASSLRETVIIILEKMLGTILIVLLLSIYKSVIYEPILNFITVGFVEQAFGKQIMDLVAGAVGGDATYYGSMPMGNLNSIYYLVVTPLAQYEHLLDAAQKEIEVYTDFFFIIKHFVMWFELFLKFIMMLAFTCITIMLGVKFVLSIFLMQVMATVTLAFGSLVLALATIPTLRGRIMLPINVIINSVMQIVPAYLFLLVWVEFANGVMQKDFSGTFVFFIYISMFLLIYFAWAVVKKAITLIINVIMELAEMIMKSSGQ